MTDFLRNTGRRAVDQNIGMHLKFGAEIVDILPNACPKDAAAGGYNIIMDYWPVVYGATSERADAAFSSLNQLLSVSK